jgi:hypothetical protein
MRRVSQWLAIALVVSVFSVMGQSTHRAADGPPVPFEDAGACCAASIAGRSTRAAPHAKGDWVAMNWRKRLGLDGRLFGPEANPYLRLSAADSRKIRAAAIATASCEIR